MKKTIGIFFLFVCIVVLCIKIIAGISNDSTPIIGITALLSYLFFNYFVLIPRENFSSIKSAIQRSGTSSEELSEKTGISTSRIEDLRGNNMYSKSLIDDLSAIKLANLCNELGVVLKNRSLKKFILKIGLVIVFVLLLDFLFAPM